jgi:hypothetical protein
MVHPPVPAGLFIAHDMWSPSVPPRSPACLRLRDPPRPRPHTRLYSHRQSLRKPTHYNLSSTHRGAVGFRRRSQFRRCGLLSPGGARLHGSACESGSPYGQSPAGIPSRLIGEAGAAMPHPERKNSEPVMSRSYASRAIGAPCMISSFSQFLRNDTGNRPLRRGRDLIHQQPVFTRSFC